MAPRQGWPAERRLPWRAGRKEASGSRSEDQSIEWEWGVKQVKQEANNVGPSISGVSGDKHTS